MQLLGPSSTDSEHHMTCNSRDPCLDADQHRTVGGSVRSIRKLLSVGSVAWDRRAEDSERSVRCLKFYSFA